MVNLVIAALSAAALVLVHDYDVWFAAYFAFTTVFYFGLAMGDGR